jgi:hypothetical protein
MRIGLHHLALNPGPVSIGTIHPFHCFAQPGSNVPAEDDGFQLGGIMAPRSALWVAAAAVIAVIIIYLLVAGQNRSGPGQPPPHALDQSQ